MKYLLDEDVNPAVAEIARGLGIDVTSVHEMGRRGLSDVAQLEFAATESRVLVTRNRDDFIEATVRFFHRRQPHAGVLIVPYTFPNHSPERMAHALADRHARRARSSGSGFASYTIDFL